MGTRRKRALERAACAVLAGLVGLGCRAERAGEEATQEAAAAPYTVERTVSDLRTPESVRVGPDGRYYVSEIGAFSGDGDGRILAVDPETWEVTIFAEGLNDPKGLAFRGELLFVTDRDRVVGLDTAGVVQVEIGPDAFPRAPSFLNDLVVGPDGSLYVSDSGEFDAADGAIYRIDGEGKVEKVIGAEDSPEIASPNGLAFDSAGALLVVDLKTGKLLRVQDGAAEVLAEGFGGGDGLEFAPDGSLYVTDFQGGRVFRVTFTADGAEAEEVASVTRAADLGLDAERGRLLIPQLNENAVAVLRLP
jgi:sugar lactone lactonase YvrE